RATAFSLPAWRASSRSCCRRWSFASVDSISVDTARAYCTHSLLRGKARLKRRLCRDDSGRELRRNMRHYVDPPRRLPSARTLARTRSRALPIVIALPLVAILWVTIGLPIISTATGSTFSNRRARNLVFLGGGSGGHSRGSSSDTVSFSTF